MAAATVKLLRDNYAKVAKDLLGCTVEVLNAGRAQCGGDLDSFLIILVVALRTAEDRRIAGMKLEDVMSGEITSYPSLSTNVRSISDSTGIPKETVRRKVAAMIDAGWIDRRENNLSLTPLASRMISEARDAILRGAICGHQVVEGVTREAGGAPEAAARR